MATISWRTNRTVKDLLLAQHSRFDAFQLLRLAQWPKPAERDAQEKTDTPLRLRFRADLSAGFAGHEFGSLRNYRVQSRRPYEVIEIKTANYCVASSLGPLPEPFSEWVRDLKRARSPAMADFLDIFNQRLNMVRYQIKSRQTLALNITAPEKTEHAEQLAAIMGLGLPQLMRQIALPMRSVLGLAGLLSNCRKSAAAITQVLSLFIGAKVGVEQFVGAWQNIEPDQHTALGRRNHRLGHHTLLGRRTWDQAARIRIVVAPLGYQRFCELLPPWHPPRAANAKIDSAPYLGLLGLLKLLLNGLHDCEVQLQLREDDVPPSRLSSSQPSGGDGAAKDGSYHGLRLRQTAWLSGKPQSGGDVRRINYVIPAFGGTERA